MLSFFKKKLNYTEMQYFVKSYHKNLHDLTNAKVSLSDLEHTNSSTYNEVLIRFLKYTIDKETSNIKYLFRKVELSNKRLETFMWKEEYHENIDYTKQNNKYVCVMSCSIYNKIVNSPVKTIRNIKSTIRNFE